jgi:hypothetical protein
MPLFLIALFETFSSGIFTTKGIAIQDVAHMSILNIENPKAAESSVKKLPLQKKVRNAETAIEASKHSGVALRQYSSVISEE